MPISNDKCTREEDQKVWRHGYSAIDDALNLFWYENKINQEMNQILSNTDKIHFIHEHVTTYYNLNA